MTKQGNERVGTSFKHLIPATHSSHLYGFHLILVKKGLQCALFVKL